MINLAQIQLLELWTELEYCYHEANKYAGDTAEIYAITLFTFVPCGNMPSTTNLGSEARIQQKILAAISLCEVCELFTKLRSCVVTIEGITPRGWCELPGEWVRAHVKVERS